MWIAFNSLFFLSENQVYCVFFHFWRQSFTLFCHHYVIKWHWMGIKCIQVSLTTKGCCYITASEKAFLLTVKMHICSLKIHRKWWMGCKGCSQTMNIYHVRIIVFHLVSYVILMSAGAFHRFLCSEFFIYVCTERHAQLFSLMSCSPKVLAEIILKCIWEWCSYPHFLTKKAPIIAVW